MATLTWLRLSRKVPGMQKGQELPNLEALIEAEGQKPGDDLQLASWLTPLILAGIGVCVFVPLGLFVLPAFYYGTLGLASVGLVVGLVLRKIVKSISPSQVLLRRRSRKLLERMSGLKSILGVEPALSKPVGSVLEEAARIYMKASAGREKVVQSGLWAEAQGRAVHAMEDAMAQMLELSEPETPQGQELLLSKAWVRKLLQEMVELDRALEQHAENARLAALTGSEHDALSGLRNAREELERIETATEELELNDR
ncbi:MAG: hypothetical protein HZC36_12755 [Armatimonadetes bacterium]|nr:hypothetical protein [Armatimonadota bacterium]